MDMLIWILWLTKSNFEIFNFNFKSLHLVSLDDSKSPIVSAVHFLTSNLCIKFLWIATGQKIKACWGQTTAELIIWYE